MCGWVHVCVSERHCTQEIILIHCVLGCVSVCESVIMICKRQVRQ